MLIFTVGVPTRLRVPLRHVPPRDWFGLPRTLDRQPPRRPRLLSLPQTPSPSAPEPSLFPILRETRDISRRTSPRGAHRFPLHPDRHVLVRPDRAPRHPPSVPHPVRYPRGHGHDADAALSAQLLHRSLPHPIGLGRRRQLCRAEHRGGGVPEHGGAAVQRPRRPGRKRGVGVRELHRVPDGGDLVGVWETPEGAKSVGGAGRRWAAWG